MEDKNDWHKHGEFPPVGAEFEFSVNGKNWEERVMLFNDGITCLMASRKHPRCRWHYECNDPELQFRPLQTERERWIKAAQLAIDMPLDHAEMLGEIYDAGLAKIPEDK